MKIVIAPDSYKESLSALELATQIELSFKEIFPDAQYLKVPMADDGEGTVQAMVEATQGRSVDVEVTAPLGERITSFYGLTGDGRRQWSCPGAACPARPACDYQLWHG